MNNYWEIYLDDTLFDYTADVAFMQFMVDKLREENPTSDVRVEFISRPDLPHGTIVMCKPKRGEHWVVQLYRKAGCTTDYESSTSTNTGWVSICPLDRFKPTSRTWMPDERDDYARK